MLITDKRFIWANINDIDCIKIKFHKINEFIYDKRTH